MAYTTTMTGKYTPPVPSLASQAKKDKMKAITSGTGSAVKNPLTGEIVKTGTVGSPSAVSPNPIPTNTPVVPSITKSTIPDATPSGLTQYELDFYNNTTTAPSVTSPTVGGQTTDLTKTINELKQAQISANMAALDKSLGNQITNIDSQYAGIDQNAYNARNVAAGESDVAAMNFAQRAAARGIQGNAASMPEIYRNSALQGRLGNIDQSALANKNILDSQKTQLRNTYESDRVGIQSGAEAQALQNLISQQNANRQFALSEAGVTGNYNGQQTMQGQSQMLSNQMAQLNVAAQEIENSYLPQTLKDEATILKQQVESGRIDIATALAQLNQIGKGGGAMDSNTAYATDYMAVQSGNTSPAAIMANQAALMSQYGEAKYKSLLELAYKYFRSSTTTGR